MAETRNYLVAFVLLVASVAFVLRYFRGRIVGQGLEVSSIRWGVIESILFLLFFQVFMGLGAVVAARIQKEVLVLLRDRLVDVGSPLERWCHDGLLSSMPIDQLLLHLTLAPVALLTVVLAYVIAVRGTRSPPCAAGLVTPPAASTLVAPALLGVSLWLPVVAVGQVWTTLLQAIGVESHIQVQVAQYARAVARHDVALVLVLGGFAVIIAPVVEEFLLRGLLHGSLRRALGPAAATILTSTIFAAIHFNVQAFVPIFCLSLFLCAVYERRGIVYDSMLVHATFNGTSLLAVSFGGLELSS